MNTTTTPEHADLMVAWVEARARLIGIRLQLDDLHQPQLVPGDRTIGEQPRVAEDEGRRRLKKAQENEQRARQALDLALRQSEDENQETGFARLRKDAGLNEDEQSILLLAFTSSISSRLARRVLEPLDGTSFCHLDVEATIRFLGPETPSDWLRSRRYFNHGAKLVSGGLITVTWPCASTSPCDLVAAEVAITAGAFGTITGELVEVAFTTNGAGEC